jgi:predicted O-methyltransferase YrrM
LCLNATGMDLRLCELGSSSVSAERLGRLLIRLGREVVATPRLAGTAVAATTWLGWRRRHAGRAVGVGIAAAAAEIAYHELIRRIRTAEDAAIIAQRAGAGAPLFGEWAAEADFTAVILRALRLGNSVVECGSGVTTIALALALADLGGHLVSLEHDPAYAAEVQHALEQRGLEGTAQIVVAPLEEQNVLGRRVLWYDAEKVGAALSRPIDVIVVDGPPQRNRWSRWPALPLLGQHPSEDTVVFVDDGRTRFARLAAFDWAVSVPGYELYWIDTVKGTWMLRPRQGETDPLAEALRRVRRSLNPRPAGFGRWPARR